MGSIPKQDATNGGCKKVKRKSKITKIIFIFLISLERNWVLIATPFYLDFTT